MSDLAAFLATMLDADEAAARKRIDDRNVQDWPYVQYFPPFDPARVLAEVEAKRRIVEWHRMVTGEDAAVWPASIAPGGAETAVFLFSVPQVPDGNIRVIVDLLASAPDVVFVGPRP